LANLCQARRLGIQEEIPRTGDTQEVIDIQEAAVVVRRRAEVFLVKRPATGRWAGLWEFPHGPRQAGEAHEQAAARLLGELTGIQADIGRELKTVRHSITHHRITLVCFEAKYQTGRFRASFYEQGRWLRPAQLAEYPVSAPQRRLAQLLLQPARQQQLF
jgi:A/G-specific adenine glycosylase